MFCTWNIAVNSGIYHSMLFFIFKSNLFLFLPGFGTNLFGLFYSIGNLCALTRYSDIPLN